MIASRSLVSFLFGQLILEKLVCDSWVDLNVLCASVGSISQKCSFSHTLELFARNSLVKFSADIEARLIYLDAALAWCNSEVVAVCKIMIALRLIMILV